MGWMTTGVQFPAGAIRGYFPLRYPLHFVFGATSFLSNGSSLLGCKSAGAWSWPLSSI